MRTSRFWVVFGALALALALFGAACGGDEEAAPPPPPAEEPAEPPAEEPAPPPAEEPPAEEPAPPAEEPVPAGEPIVIGAAMDLTGGMAPFDGPALAAAQNQAAKLNAADGVGGRQIEIKVIDTQLDAEQTKSAAIDLIDNQGAQILFVTCDVDFATPAIQEALNRGVLAIAPCIGTDQMGPQRFGEQGKIAFTFGNVAQDEGAAMAEFAADQGWTKAIVVKDNLIVYFQDVVDAFAKRFAEVGGEVVQTEEYLNSIAGAETGGTIQNVISAIADTEADVIAISTAYDDLPALVGGLRSLGIETPIICSWACDGTYWNPEGLSSFYTVSYASLVGDDPVAEVNALVQELTDAGTPPAASSFVGGAAVIDALAAAILETGGTDATSIADVFEGFQGFPTISGNVSFSPELHGVFGREMRVMQVQDGVLSFLELRAATSPAEIR
jgi:branched-chain amino acid transport system substrate-binding protein